MSSGSSRWKNGTVSGCLLMKRCPTSRDRLRQSLILELCAKRHHVLGKSAHGKWMNGGASRCGVGMRGGIVVLRTWRPPVAQAEVGPLSNAAREKRADPSLTWLRKGQKTRKISHRFGFYGLPVCTTRHCEPGPSPCGQRSCLKSSIYGRSGAPGLPVHASCARRIFFRPAHFT